VAKRHLQQIHGINIENFTNFGQQLQSILSLNEPNQIVQHYGSFLQGACLVLGEALQWLEPQLQLCVTIRDDGATDHVLARFNDAYIDADGVGTYADVVTKMQTIEMVQTVSIRPLHLVNLNPEIQSDSETVQKLVTYLKPKLDFNGLRNELQK
jgi:hypothetical protein